MLLMAFMAPWAVGQQSLPYEYGFENNNLATDGWTLQASSSDTKISTAALHTDNYGFQFHYTENPNAYLVSPVLTGGTNGVDVSFYYKSYSGTYPETFTVGYTTDAEATDPSEFTYPNACMIENAPTTWALFEYSFPAGTKKVAVKYIYTNAYYLYLDDFHFEATSSCPKPTDLTATNVTNNSATLGWTSNADSWNLQYKDSGSGPDDWTTINSVTNPYTLNGVLSEKTTYQFQVQPVCGGTPGNYSSPVSLYWNGAVKLKVFQPC